MEKIDIVLGAQFGDEGKGRIVGYMCASGKYDICARFNGSDNAGHTVIIDSDKKIAFRQVPVGSAYGMACIIGRGCIVDLNNLNDEIKEIEKISGGWVLYLDNRCHVKTQGHRRRDAEEEKSRSESIGTTLSGNGPAHADKYARRNIRVCDIDINEYPNIRRRAILADTSLFLASSKCEHVLVEGAHGIMLDIDHGTYPFVTSSGCTAGAACHSLGIPPHRIGKVIGVIKPYITRVGAGAFPTEILDDELSSKIREIGREYGTNTGRPRRIGWLDLQALTYAVRVGGITEIALTKVDILNELFRVRICIGYEHTTRGHLPSKDFDYREVKPMYVDLEWGKYSRHNLMDLIERHVGVPVTMVSDEANGGLWKP